jgi:hypothetical protein
MADVSDTIRQDIESTRQTLETNIDRLTNRVRESVDLRHQVRQHPLAMLGAAVATGLVLGGQFREKRITALRAELGQELDLLADAVIRSLIDVVHTVVREQLPIVGRHLDEAACRTGRGRFFSSPL